MSTVKALVRFVKKPEVGFVLIHDDQMFEVVRVEPYQRKDGDASSVLTWRTTCRKCPAPVEFQCGQNLTVKRRNCDQHKRGARQ